ncbi:LysR family transcriptional regulator [Lampropedia puyangensis]|nr:LysR family transcriptional regulator [Lampropedia puyangensis]
MDTSFINSFVMIAECGSLAEASRRSGLTAPALAQRIRALELEFGVTLFVRSGRTVALTESGRRLLEQAYRFQGAVRDLYAATAADGIGKTLRLGTIFTGLSGLVPRMLTELRARHPELETNVVLGISQNLYHQVLRDELDVALIVKPPFALPKSVEWRQLRLEPLVVLAPTPWAHESPMHLLRTKPLVRYERQNWGGAYANAFLQSEGIEPDARYELDSLEGIALLVSEGLGVSLVPNWARVGGMPQGVEVLPIACHGFERPVGLQFRQGYAGGHRLADYLLERESSRLGAMPNR